ncbi:hypothetical protein [Pelagicoccus albus]|uniref:Cytochrome oxidase subunit I profile domain-containing protein n=1 Tax=Pelagicoccus albus TaxID=415222 RepID=A0A7X1B9Y5_9BACT|nr:hypothetical protein [Pelagicoccus albus]MBC2607123.1 hypothetical protein [Pelagicoccus albus]
MSSQARVEKIQEQVAWFSVIWLAAANLVGLWLAILLLWPSLGNLYGKLGYGRWMPLHMDWQLYGWCSMPSLGLVALRFGKHVEGGVVLCSRSFWIWSSVLLVGGVTWLLGDVTGKPFLNWSGFSRRYLLVALLVVWVMLLWSWWPRFSHLKGTRSKLDFALDGLALAMLGCVPWALFWVSDASIYPPVNPHSGGATGHSLMLSTLSIVVLMGALPGIVLGLKKREEVGRSSFIWFAVLYLASIALYQFIEHGNASNSDWDQIIGLGSLMIWPIMVAWVWNGFAWREGSRLWRGMFVFWWSLLAVSGWVFFLPDVLLAVKFTNAMVGHAHLAMAGMVSALNMIILTEMGGSSLVSDTLGSRGLTWAWNVGLFIFVGALMAQGVIEGKDPQRLFLFDTVSQLVYLLRLLSGALLLGCSFVWCRKLWIQKKA